MTASPGNREVCCDTDVMGKTYERIDGRLRAFIEAQRIFFVATAPLDGDGTVNLSPKGLTGSFAVIDAHTLAGAK